MTAQPRRKVTWKTVNKEQIKLSAVIEEYLVYHEALNHSPKTVEWYSYILSTLSAFIGADAPLSEVTVQSIRAYQSHLRSRRNEVDHPLSDRTLFDHVRALKTFIRWLENEQYLDEVISSRIDLPRVAVKEIQVLTEDELTALFSRLPLGDDQGCRNLAIVSLMADCGLRLSEVAALSLDDLFLAESTVRVMGKGRREARVPFGASTAKVLRRYVQHFRPYLANGTDALFVNQFGSRLGVEGIKKGDLRHGHFKESEDCIK